MRSRIKEWDNRKERRINGRYNGWTRRVIWYEGDCLGTGGPDIRLAFEDEEGKFNSYFTDMRKAQKAYDAFRNDGVSAMTAAAMKG